MTSKEILTSLESESEIELVVTGRRSGKAFPRPIWFVLGEDRESIMLVPMNGRKTQWYLNVKENPSVGLKVGGHYFEGNMSEVEANRLKNVLGMFDAKYGKNQMQNYYTNLDVAMEVPLPD